MMYVILNDKHYFGCVEMLAMVEFIKLQSGYNIASNHPLNFDNNFLVKNTHINAIVHTYIYPKTLYGMYVINYLKSRIMCNGVFLKC